MDSYSSLKVVAPYLEMVSSPSELESCENKITIYETELVTPKLAKSRACSKRLTHEPQPSSQ